MRHNRHPEVIDVRPGARAVRVTCWSCGEVEVAAKLLTVRRCVGGGAETYRFRCAGCGLDHVAGLARDAALGLVAAGSSLVEWDLPDRRALVR